MIHGYLLQLKPSRTSLYLEDIPEDIPDHPELHDDHHDAWHHYHSITFLLRIPKIYNTWIFIAIKPPRTSLNLEDIPEDIPDHPDLPDGYQDDWSCHH